MNRISELFARKNSEILNVYFTAGHPQLDSTVPIILSLDKAGADLVEVGIPYSDPLADGLTIQQSSQRALKNGMTLDHLFAQISEARKTSEIPLVLMGYYNQMLQYGPEKFITSCVDSGVDGLIIPDLPLSIFEEKYKTIFNDHGIFVSLLKQCNPIDSYLDHIVYFLKFGPINYLVQPARRELEQLLPRNVSTRLFYYELLRLSGHLIAQLMYEFKIMQLENEPDAGNFGNIYFVRQDGINYMWPTAVDDYEPLRLQSMSMADAKDSKFFSFTTLQHCTNQHIIDGGMKILRELVSKNSIISTYMLDTPLCRTSSDHIQHLCVGLLEYQFWMVLPDELQELYFAMISVKGYQYELFLDRSFFHRTCPLEAVSGSYGQCTCISLYGVTVVIRHFRV